MDCNEHNRPWYTVALCNPFFFAVFFCVFFVRVCVRVLVVCLCCDSDCRFQTRASQGTHYVAVVAKMSSASTVSVKLSDIGISGKSCSTRDLWERKDMGSSGSTLAVRVPGSAGHYFGALYALTQCQ